MDESSKGKKIPDFRNQKQSKTYRIKILNFGVFGMKKPNYHFFAQKYNDSFDIRKNHFSDFLKRKIFCLF